jgi:IQ motif/SEC7 domain-containing protein
VHKTELRPGTDHVTQVVKVDRSIVGARKPVLALPHRRLVCYCRLAEVVDPAKRQPVQAHQRDVFLFNDLILVTKATQKKKQSSTYAYRESHSLVGVQLSTFSTPHYEFGVRMYFTLDSARALHFNAKNAQDRMDFMRDLNDAIQEVRLLVTV